MNPLQMQVAELEVRAEGIGHPVMIMLREGAELGAAARLQSDICDRSRRT